MSHGVNFGPLSNIFANSSLCVQLYDEEQWRDSGLNT